MKSENSSFFDKIRPIFSGLIFIILVIGVGFLSVNFILALIAKFA